MRTAKRNGPRAAGTARKARIVASPKPTQTPYSKPTLDASAYARIWVARRYRLRSRWAGLIADAAGLGVRP
jgi:hypothetical protein